MIVWSTFRGGDELRGADGVGLEVVTDGVLAGRDLPAMEGELLDRARTVVAIDPARAARWRRRREAVRAHYAGGSHLRGPGVPADASRFDGNPD